MEKAAAVETFDWSISLHNLKNTPYVGDRDCSSFDEVCEAMKKKIYNDYLVLKDCVEHSQKKMGSNLRKYKRDAKRKLSDGGRVGGRGRLNDAMTDNFQNYYGAAIRNNKISVHKMKDAIWAIHYHCILSENKPLSLPLATVITHCHYTIEIVFHVVDINVTKQRQQPLITKTNVCHLFLGMN